MVSKTLSVIEVAKTYFVTALSLCKLKLPQHLLLLASGSPMYLQFPSQIQAAQCSHLVQVA